MFDAMFVKVLLEDVDEDDDEDEDDDDEESEFERVTELFGICSRFSTSIVLKLKLFDDVDVLIN